MNISVFKSDNYSVNFTADPTRAAWRIMNGIPEKVTSEYAGFTGQKNFHFPTVSNLDKSKYPDITGQYEALLQSIIETVNKNLGKSKIINFFRKCKTLGENFKASDKWDTKFLEDFPGKDKNGKAQFAFLKDKIVNAHYVSNAIYAETLSRLGFKKWFAKMAAQIDAHGISNLLFEGKFPTIKSLKFSDTKFDQEVIDSVYSRQLKSQNS